jgi:hypothetical protein
MGDVTKSTQAYNLGVKSLVKYITGFLLGLDNSHMCFRKLVILISITGVNDK